MKTFAIVNSYRKNRAVGELRYDPKRKEFRITIAEGVAPRDMPLMLEFFSKKGMREIPPDWSLKWVQERIVPPNRQNIGAILKAHGLQFYDEAAIIENTRGVCMQDDFELVPIEQFQEDMTTMTPHRIKRLRQDLCLTQSAFAAKLGVSLKSVEAWEGGRSKPCGAAMRLLMLLDDNPDLIYKM